MRGFPFSWLEHPNIVPIVDSNRAEFSFVAFGFLEDFALYFGIVLFALWCWKGRRK